MLFDFSSLVRYTLTVSIHDDGRATETQQQYKHQRAMSPETNLCSSSPNLAQLALEHIQSVSQ
jgi:hypothetical protein